MEADGNSGIVVEDEHEHGVENEHEHEHEHEPSDPRATLAASGRPE